MKSLAHILYIQVYTAAKWNTSLKLGTERRSQRARTVAICKSATTPRTWRLNSWTRSIAPTTSFAFSSFQHERSQTIIGGVLTMETSIQEQANAGIEAVNARLNYLADAT